MKTWSSTRKLISQHHILTIKFVGIAWESIKANSKMITAKNTVISPNLVRKFCGKADFPHSFGRFTPNYAETVPFHKMSIPEN